ncbi:MAG TPA: hypothetical protein VGI19_00175 [Candidatus Cybelea sp.]|jgi:hypothetical protein
MSVSRLRLIAGAALSVTVALAGCAQSGPSQQTMLPQVANAAVKPDYCVGGASLRSNLSALATANVPAQPNTSKTSKHSREMLYVLLVGNTEEASVELFDAYAKNPKLMRTVGNLGTFPSAIWTDGQGNVYVGLGQSSLDSSVVVYRPGMTGKPLRTYTKGIALPFGGTVDSKGNVYVSDGGLIGYVQGDVAIYPPGKLKPSQIKYNNVYVPHGIAVDAKRDIFVANVYGKLTFVVEFPHDAYEGIILPLNDLKGGFLQGLVLDSHNDIVTADECNPAVRFYPPPYKNESAALTQGLFSPDSVAYAPDGSLFVGNQFVGNYGNVVVYAPGASQPNRTIVDGINGQVFGVAIGRTP